MLSKKLILIISLLFFFSSTFPLNAATPKDFNDKFVGVNSIHLTDKFTPEKIDTSLSYLTNSCGVSIVRLFLPYTDYPGLSNLKYTLQKGSEYGIKFIITLGDSWRLESGLNFYPGDLETYKQRARDAINRLKNDYGSAVFAWELLNEPHCDYGKITTDADGNSTREFDPTCPNRLYNFVRDFSAEIKQLDPTHPVTIGLIGKHGDGRTSIWSQFDPKTGPYAGSDFVALNNIDTIDAAENHVYSVSMETIQNDIDKANHINKPFFVEEYGPDGIKKPKAEQLKEKMRGSFDYGANGFLVWEYTPIGNDGDQFAFNQNKNNSLCQALKDESIRQDAIPEEYTLGPLDPSYSFTPPPNCELELMEFENVHITEVKRDRRTSVAKHPIEEDSDYVANANLPTNGTDYTLVCQSFAKVEKEITPENPNPGPDDPPVTERIIEERLENDDYSEAINQGQDLEQRFSKTTNPWGDIKNAFTSFAHPISTFFRLVNNQKQSDFQYQRLENIALFLAGKDVISQESQLGWWQPDTQQCSTLNCGRPDNTQPIWLSQLAYSYRDKLSSLAKSTLEAYYTPDQLLPQACAQKLLQFLNPSTPGSLAGQIAVKQGDNITLKDRGLPRTAILADPLTQNIQDITIPSNQQNTTSTQICSYVKTPSSGSTTKVGPLRFLVKVKAFFRGLLSEKIAFENRFDSRLEKGVDKANKFTKNFIPQKTIEEIDAKKDSSGSTVNEEKDLQFIDPGNPAYLEEFNLHPASWNEKYL